MPEIHDLVTVYKLGRRVDYTVPSFPVFSASMREAVYQRVSSADCEAKLYTGLIRDTPELKTRPFPSILRLCPGDINAFFTPNEGFGVRSSSLEISGKVAI